MCYNKIGDIVKELFNKLNIKPKNIENYTRAFQHKSYVNENKLKHDYERLEFLGDAVLELAISDYLFNNFDLQEGDLTKIRASYVCENALYEYSSHLKLSKYIKVGHGEENSGGRYKKVIMADIFESLMGAIYLDLGYDVAKRVILGIIVPYIEDPTIIFFSDYKTALQEYVQTEKRTLIYKIVEESGPSHSKFYKIEVRVDGILFGVGEGTSKKEAEQEAARDSLLKLAIK